MITKYSATGEKTRGTVNNCANGYTPWATYLTCEENWAGYFRRIAATDDPKRSAKEKASLARYGVAGTGRELWATLTPDTADNLYGRWNAEVVAAGATEDYRNVANTYGWVVEIDPFNPTTAPVKRTGLGRFKHESAQYVVDANNNIAFYMGDDERNEYIYKFVCAGKFNPTNRAANRDLLDSGTLYVARFNNNLSGEWIALQPGTIGVDGKPLRENANFIGTNDAEVLAKILIKTRMAAEAVRDVCPHHAHYTTAMALFLRIRATYGKKDTGETEAEVIHELSRGPLLIIDETHTISLGPGGATATWSLRPDAIVIGKAIAGGMPGAAYGMNAQLAERVGAATNLDEIDTGGIGGTVSGNVLSAVAIRATLGEVLTDAAFPGMVAGAERWADGVEEVLQRRSLGWSVARLGARAEYHFAPENPRNGGEAAAAVDHELERYLHLHALVRGIVITPFHNMALMCPATTQADVDLHTAVFDEMAAELVG